MLPSAKIRILLGAATCGTETPADALSVVGRDCATTASFPPGRSYAGAIGVDIGGGGWFVIVRGSGAFVTRAGVHIAWATRCGFGSRAVGPSGGACFIRRCAN